ncbi:unnamed protein product [Aphis gossypii]|uniref:Uncharacterized protein n=1 Tax=Aphis gossypii TaxID=80765 RepID=A0A9P0J2E1_APHGO|nr:unnamed protein product [Aphis gossypii]
MLCSRLFVPRLDYLPSANRHRLNNTAVPSIVVRWHVVPDGELAVHAGIDNVHVHDGGAEIVEVQLDDNRVEVHEVQVEDNNVEVVEIYDISMDDNTVHVVEAQMDDNIVDVVEVQMDDVRQDGQDIEEVEVVDVLLADAQAELELANLFNDVLLPDVDEELECTGCRT